MYAKARPEIESVQIDIFINNAIEDQSYVSNYIYLTIRKVLFLSLLGFYLSQPTVVEFVIPCMLQALDQSLISHYYTPLLRDMPVLCFGNGKDVEVTLSNDSNYATPLGTKSILFGQIWRHNKVGSSHVTFEVGEILVHDDKALTLKVQQAGSQLYHEANFLLTDL